MYLFHGTDVLFESFDFSQSIGIHFGSEQAAKERLRTTGCLFAPMDLVELDDGRWIVEERVWVNDDPVEHGPFESEEAALTFSELHDAQRRPMAFHVQVNSALDLPDLGGWSFDSMVMEFSRVLPGVDEGERDRLYAAWQRSDAAGWQALRDLLIRNGFDAISYTNEVEDRGSRSWIVLRPEAISPAGDDHPMLRRKKTEESWPVMRA